MKAHACLVVMTFVFAASAARAEEPAGRVVGDSGSEAGRPPRISASIGIGSTQAYGAVGDHLNSLNDWGGALDLELGARLGSHWGAGVYGTLASYRTAKLEGAAFSGSAGIQASYTFGPQAGILPKLSAGFGWHGHFAPGDDGRVALQGYDLLRVQLGFEKSLTPDFSLSPVLGASLATFRWQKLESAAAYRDVEDPGVTLFVFGGVRGELGLLD